MNPINFIQQFYSIFDPSEIKDLEFIWNKENFYFTENSKAKKSIPHYLDLIKGYKLPTNVVPLAKERFPFKEYDFDILLKLLKMTLLFPEKEGRLSSSIREILGFERIMPNNYVIKEAHIDITKTTKNLKKTFLKLGFEPDHFKDLFPERYTECFTMEFSPTYNQAHRIRAIHSYILRSCDSVQNSINEYDECESYLEVESYSNKSIKKYDFEPIEAQGIDNFPFSESSFNKIYVPNRRATTQDQKITVDTSKAVDIHVKIPTIHRGKGYEMAGSPHMKNLCERFEVAGFYRIFSEGGNYIFTAQLLDVRVAKNIFITLDEFAKEYGGILGIKLEICTKFWRKELIKGTDNYFSEVPYLIELN